MAILINDNTSRVEYTATSGQVTFAVPFEFFENANLNVYKNGVELTYDATPANANEYSVTGANVTGGGSITLGSPGAALNDVIVISREVTVERLTDFPLAGPFNIDSLNNDLDRIIVNLQNLQTTLDSRVFKLADGDSPLDLLTIPAKSLRTNKYLVFDSNGQVAVSTGTGDSGLRQDLANTAVNQGASLVQTTSGTNVQAKLNAIDSSITSLTALITAAQSDADAAQADADAAQADADLALANAATAIANAATAQSTADGKIESFYQNDAPVGGSLGDFWIDTNDGNKLYRHNGTSFVAIQDSAIATAIANAATAQATADGKVTTFYSASAPTAEGVGDLWYDTDDAILYRWNGSNWSSQVADVTSSNQIVIADVDPFIIQADASGITTTGLPLTRGIKVYKGGVQQTSGITVGTLNPTTGITATASVATGVVNVSLTVANAAGSIVVPVIFEGVTYNKSIVVSRSLAAPISGGTSGSTSFTDQTWDNISTATYVAVTDADAQVQSDGSGQLKLNANAMYQGNTTAQIQTQYSSDNSNWTVVASATGSAPINTPGEEEPGYVEVGPTTVTGLTASTNYYVRLVAKRTSGTGLLSWNFPSFTAQQP